MEQRKENRESTISNQEIAQLLEDLIKMNREIGDSSYITDDLDNRCADLDIQFDVLVEHLKSPEGTKEQYITGLRCEILLDEITIKYKNLQVNELKTDLIKSKDLAESENIRQSISDLEKDTSDLQEKIGKTKTVSFATQPPEVYRQYLEDQKQAHRFDGTPKKIKALILGLEKIRDTLVETKDTISKSIDTLKTNIKEKPWQKTAEKSVSDPRETLVGKLQTLKDKIKSFIDNKIVPAINRLKNRLNFNKESTKEMDIEIVRSSPLKVSSESQVGVMAKAANEIATEVDATTDMPAEPGDKQYQEFVEKIRHCVELTEGLSHRDARVEPSNTAEDVAPTRSPYPEWMDSKPEAPAKENVEEPTPAKPAKP